MPTSYFRNQLHISIGDDPYFSEQGLSSPASTSSLASSTRVSVSTSRASFTTARSYDSPETSVSDTTDGEDWVLFSVLCLHTFESDDPDHLIFGKNEILDVVKQEESGWWAALRRNGAQVGWIPSAFVAALNSEELDKLQKVHFDLRVFEYEAEKLYNSAPISQLHHMYPGREQSHTESRREEWITVVKGAKVPSASPVTPTDQMPRRNHSYDSADGEPPFSGADVDSPGSARFRVPPSPSTPTPQPPPSTAPLLIHKPTPPTPKLPTSASVLQTHCQELSRSRSESASSLTSGRSQRRRPLLVDAHVSLSRLSTLIESNNPREVQILTSPQMSGSLESFSRASGRSSGDTSKSSLQDDDISNFSNSNYGQSHMPWYLRPAYNCDVLKVDPEGRVRAGTLLALVERLTTAPPMKPAYEGWFRKIFLTTFRSFCGPETLFDHLVERYQMDHPATLSTSEFKEWKAEKLRPTQERVLAIFAEWVHDYHMLDEEPYMAKNLIEFLSLILIATPNSYTADVLLQKVKALTNKLPAPVNHQQKRKKSKSLKSDILKLNPDDVAEQLALHQFQLYAAVRPQECLNWVHAQTGAGVVNLTNFCGTHDKVVAWVKMSILNNDILGKRSDTLDFWIKVLEKCRVLNNFASMSAILTALSSIVLTKLHLTWSHAGRRAHLDPLVKYNDPTGGFSGFRSLLQAAEGPCVPFVLPSLTEIVHIQDAHADYHPLGTSQNPLISFTKRQKWSDAISSVLRYQNEPYLFRENESVKGFMEAQIRVAMTKDEDWFFDRSAEVQRTELANADFRKGLVAAGF